ncbi:MAG TPA: hypothetical protein VN030_13595 [Cellvibrio sp.]|nr:hypothetical protein [Cellvibrio sp.]
MISNKLKILATASIVALSSCAFAAPSTPSVECTAGISNLLKLVSRSDFFDEPSDTFVKKSTTFLHIAKNETAPKSNYSERARRITLKKEPWLDSGKLSYFSTNDSPFVFTRADFAINMSCSPKYKDFLALASKNITGKFLEQRIPELENYISRTWTMPDPEEYFERRIEVVETTDSLFIKIERAYVPEGDGEE